MLTIKLTDEQMATLGISTSEEAFALLNKPAQEAAQAAQPAHVATADVLSAMAATNASILKMDAAFKTMSDSLSTRIDAVAKESRIIAAQEVSSAIAKSGSAAVVAQAMKPDENPGPAKPADDDYKGQFAADKNIQAEFISERAYVLFMEAQKQGRITINNTRS